MMREGDELDKSEQESKPRPSLANDQKYTPSNSNHRIPAPGYDNALLYISFLERRAMLAVRAKTVICTALTP